MEFDFIALINAKLCINEMIQASQKSTLWPQFHLAKKYLDINSKYDIQNHQGFLDLRNIQPIKYINLR